jgi:peptidoglycan/xylan/chitin deacetylase (PgdA/CDA1 family)
MAYVAGAYRVMPLDEMVERARKGSLPRNSLAITFDDGYRDNLTHAAPILHRHRLPATVFLATGLIGTGVISWFDRLAVALKLTKVATVRTPWGETFVLRDRTARLAALDRAQNHLKTLADDELQRALDVLLEALDVPDAAAPKNLMLDWADARALTGLGFDVGGHTVSHVILSRVTAERARAEIQGLAVGDRRGSRLETNGIRVPQRASRGLYTPRPWSSSAMPDSHGPSRPASG